MEEERLQKYMARCGIASRRKCEELIAEGLVEVNGEVIREAGVKVDPARDRIKVSGKVLRQEKPAYYVHYKVKGVTTTVSDDLGRKTVMDCLPNIRERLFPVGRLDKESEGLLILTNDGEMANYLTHPANGVAKTYRVVAEGRIGEDVIRTLQEKGMRLGPVLVKPTRVELVRYDNDNTVVLITVSEGINREVRRIFAALGHEVKRLLRTQVGPIGLTGMKRGATRPLTARELSLLRKGMEGMDPAEAYALFPPGSAASRRPTGPRGRPRRVKAPRQGKPDPADAKFTGARRPSTPRGEKVVMDDWQKESGPRNRRGRNAPEAEALATTAKPFRAQGPAKSARGPKPSERQATGKTPRPQRSGMPTSGPKSPDRQTNARSFRSGQSDRQTTAKPFGSRQPSKPISRPKSPVRQPAARPLRPLRPTKAPAGAKPPERKAAAKPVKMISHPLAAPAKAPARPKKNAGAGKRNPSKKKSKE